MLLSSSSDISRLLPSDDNSCLHVIHQILRTFRIPIFSDIRVSWYVSVTGVMQRRASFESPSFGVSKDSTVELLHCSGIWDIHSTVPGSFGLNVLIFCPGLCTHPWLKCFNILSGTLYASLALTTPVTTPQAHRMSYVEI